MKRTVKRLMAAALMLTSVLTSAYTAYADDTEDGTLTYEEALQASYDIIPDTNQIEGWPQGPQVYGNSAIVMDMDSGAVLYEKKADDRHYPASITKILTALVALENSQPEDEVYFSDDSVSFLEYGDASIGMRPGEILTRKDAMYGMLLASANEVSYAIAENVGKEMGGDYQTFIQAMNDRAQELGCTGSHWMNANGLHDEQHYTTARDMALIASAVYRFEEFRTVTQTLEYTIGTTNLVNETRTFQQNHKMLWPGSYYYYESCTGGKTGYTDQSRTTLVTMAENNGLRLAAVILQDDGDVYIDTRAMFDYAYSSFTKTLLSDQEKPEEVLAYDDADAYVLLPAGVEFSSLESEITVTDEKKAEGTVTYYYEGQNVGSADVTLTEEALAGKAEDAQTPQSDAADGTAQKAEKDPQQETAVILTRMLTCAGVAIFVLIVFLLMLLRYRIVKQRRRRMAMARRRQRIQNSGRSADWRSERSAGTQRRQMRSGREERGVRDRNGRYR